MQKFIVQINLIFWFCLVGQIQAFGLDLTPDNATTFQVQTTSDEIPNKSCVGILCRQRTETRGAVFCPNTIKPTADSRRLLFSGNCGVPYDIVNLCSKNYYFAHLIPDEFREFPEEPHGDGCEMLMSKELEKQVKVNFKKCVRQASQAQGWGIPSKIYISHIGCMLKRRARYGKKISSHSTGSAIDIKRIFLKFSKNKSKIVEIVKPHNFRPHPQRTFIDTLRKCWHNQHSCNRSIGYTYNSYEIKRGKRRGYNLTPPLGCPRKGLCRDQAINNQLHWHHLHLSHTCARDGKPFPKHSGRAHSRF